MRDNIIKSLSEQLKEKDKSLEVCKKFFELLLFTWHF